MFERFNEEYQIVKVYKNTLLCVNKKSRQEVLIHHSNYNSLEQAVDYREVKTMLPDNKTGELKSVIIVEVLVWKGINKTFVIK
jgi:hypothetical protein